jgi:dTDP-4-amino-4,6-dideoxygalactose transaminase
MVLEDGAQAHGALYKGQRIGAHADAVAWSFYPGKNLGAFGDGGAVTTNNPDIADRLRVLRNYGSRVKYVNEVQGFNSRLDPLHASVLSVKLQLLDEWNTRRELIAKRYITELSTQYCVLPETPPWASPAWHLFVVRTQHREALQAHLQERGIGTLIHYPIPPHLQTAYAGAGFATDDFPIARQLADEVLSLPMGPHLSYEDVGKVIDAFNDFSLHSLV